LLLIALSSVGFSFQSGLVHYIGNDVCPVQQTGLRGLVAWLLVVPCLVHQMGGPSRSWWGSREVYGWLFLRSVSGFLSNAFAFLALARASSLGDASALIFTSPLFTAVYAAVLLGERSSVLVVLSLFLGLAGTVLVTRPSFLGFDSALAADVVSCAFALTSAVCGGFVFVALRRTRQEHFLVLLNWQMLAQAVLGLLGAAFTCGLRFQLPAWEWGILLSYGFAAFAAQLCMTIGARSQNAAASSAMRTCDVVIAYGIQVVYFPDDNVSFLSIFGTVLICSSIFLIVLERIFCTSPSDDAASTAPAREFVPAGRGKFRHEALPSDPAEPKAAGFDDDQLSPVVLGRQLKVVAVVAGQVEHSPDRGTNREAEDLKLLGA